MAAANRHTSIVQSVLVLYGVSGRQGHPPSSAGQDQGGGGNDEKADLADVGLPPSDPVPGFSAGAARAV